MENTKDQFEFACSKDRDRALSGNGFGTWLIP